MAYTLNSVDLTTTYGITPSHAPGSNIAMEGCFDMPQRTGTTYKDWGDNDGVEPWVGANDIMFGGRDIVFSGFLTGTVSAINTKLQTFYTAIDAATGLSIFATPYHSASGYIKSVIPEHLPGGCTVKMTFREPAVALTGTLPASGTSGAYTIDNIPFSSFGLYLSKAERLHDLPENKEQYFTKYGQEGCQIVKRKNKMLEMNGFVTGSTLTNFITNVKALYKVFSSSGTRTIVLDTIVTVVCFATEGFKIDNIHYSNVGVIARFHINLMVKSVAYYVIPAGGYLALLNDGNTVGWYLADNLATITKDGSDFVSQWNDYLAGGNNLLQAAGTNQPLWVSPGTIRFDGVDNFLKCVAFTYNQPEEIWLICKLVSYTYVDYLFDGNTVNKGVIYQDSVPNTLKAYAGTSSAANANLSINTWGVIRVLFSGAASEFKIDATATVTGNFGASNMGGFTLGSTATPSNYGTIEVKEVILRKIADTASDITLIYDYLAARKP